MTIKKELRKVTLAALFTFALGTLAFAGNEKEGNEKDATKQATESSVLVEFQYHGPIDLGYGYYLDLSPIAYSFQNLTNEKPTQKSAKKTETKKTDKIEDSSNMQAINAYYEQAKINEILANLK